MRVGGLFLIMLGLAGSASGIKAEKNLRRKIEGEWRTVYLAASNPDKLAEGSALRIYFRRLACTRRCLRVNFFFYTRKGGKCVPHKVVGRREQDVYYTEYEGHSAILLKAVRGNTLLFHYYNKNPLSWVTRVAGVLAKGKQLTKDEMNDYMNFVEEIGIEDENVQRVLDTDTCPSTMPLS